MNYAGKAPGWLYRHVGLNLYDQPLSRGRISSAIGIAVLSSSLSFCPFRDLTLETSAAGETSRRRRFSIYRESWPRYRRRAMPSVEKSAEREGNRKGSRQRFCTEYEVEKSGGCDVRRNSGMQSQRRAAARICQPVHTRVRLSTRNKNYT